MAIEWNDHESHALPGVSEALDAAGVDTGACESLRLALLPEPMPPTVEVDARLVTDADGEPVHPTS